MAGQWRRGREGDVGGEAAVGGRVLAEVEETTLEEVLACLRTALLDGASHHGRPKATPMAALDEVAARHFSDTQVAAVAVSGRGLALVYRLVSSLVSPPHSKAVVVVDVAGRFDATRLACAAADLRHVYVHVDDDHSSSSSSSSSSPEHVRALVAAAEAFMLYDDAAQASRSRQWWGTVVVGAGPGAGDVVAGWQGWLRVDRAHVPPFAPGLTAHDALAQRATRQDAVDAAAWTAASRWGDFSFNDA